MKLVDLLNIANRGYPDHSLSEAYNPEDGAEPDGAEDAVGDTLALFIVRELRDTFDPGADRADQIGEAVRVMRIAKRDLSAVGVALEQALVET